MTGTSPPTEVGEFGSRYPCYPAITFLFGARLGISDCNHPKRRDGRQDRHNRKR